MEHSPLTWRERAQLWLRLGLRGALALGGVALFVYVGLPLASLLSPFLFALVLAGCSTRRCAGSSAEPGCPARQCRWYWWCWCSP